MKTSTITDAGAQNRDDMAGHCGTGPVPATAKWSFTVRRVGQEDVHGLSTGFASAIAGDVVLGQTEMVGQHKEVQLRTGRMSENIVGDHVMMVVGDRYAPDQSEGVAEIDPEGCAVIAGGGMPGRVTVAHAAMMPPTMVRPIGLLTNSEGKVINIMDYALPNRSISPDVTVIGVFGTSMNSGKTTTSMSLALGLRRAGFRVAAVKATGTGAFGDYNAFLDAGVPVSDFVDAGMPSTYRMPLERIERRFETLVGTAAAAGAEIVVVEFADGVFQTEMAAILRGSAIVQRLDGVIFAAYDALGAYGGVSVLERHRLRPFAVSGLVTCSPLGIREAEAATGLRLVSRDELRDPNRARELTAPVFARAGARMMAAA